MGTKVTMRFFASLLLLCSITFQILAGNGGWTLRRPIPKGQIGTVPSNTIVVYAGPDQSITTTNFTLSGGATNTSYPAEPLNFSWSLVSPQTVVAFSSPTSATTDVVVTNTTAISYVFRLTASNDRYFASDTVTIFKAAVLTTNQPPSITVISDQTTLENHGTNVSWVATDDTTPPSSLTYIISSSNTNLVPNLNLVLGAARTNLTMTPITHSNGVTVISITPVDNKLLPGTTRQFNFNVTATNDPPTITTPPGQTTPQNVSKTVSFSVGDIETPAANLVCSASSSDTSLVLNSQLVLGGSGANRTVQITPVTNARGNVTITIRVSDGQIVTQTTFLLTITSVNQPPTLVAIPDVSMVQDTSRTISLIAADSDSTLTPASFSTTATSNPSLIGLGDITFGGSIGAWTATMTPKAGQTGTSTLTIQVSDGLLSTNKSFVLTVTTCALDLGDRIVAWSPGVPGGIPSLSASVNVTTYGAVGNGTTDCYPAFTNALAHATANSAINITNGVFLLSKPVEVTKNGVVFRGLGPGSTKIVSTGTGDGIFYFHGSSSTTSNAVVSGANFGSTNITVDNAGAYSVGSYIILEQSQDSAVLEGNLPSLTEYYQSQRLQVTAKSGNTLTVSRPIYYTYNPAKNIHIKPWTPITNCGVESLYLQPSGSAISNLTANLYFFQAANCWVRNVESTNAYSFHIALDKTLSCEVRSNYLHHSQAYGQGGYGVDITLSSDNLIEDNIFYYLRHGVIVQNGANGNVVAYNYGRRVFQQDWPYTDILQSDIEMHGGHPYMNLVEGNVGVQFSMDSFWGSSRNNTFFRNWIQRYSDGEYNPITLGLQAMDVEKFQLYENIIGNVSSRPSDVGCIYNFGRNNNATCTDPIIDTRVTNTMVFTANFDFVSSATQFDPTNCHTLPISMFRTTKPSFFAATNNWPPIGSDVNVASNITNFALIPAQSRFVQPTEMVFPTIAPKTAPMNGSVTFPVTATDQAWPLVGLSGTSGNTTLQPNAGIVVTGTPGNWNVTLTPANNQFGTATITMKASDTLHTNSQAFVLTVNQSTLPPTITSIANLSIAKNTSTAALPFTIADPDTPVASLVLGRSSSNPTLLATTGIVFGGSGGSRTATLTPVTGQFGSATVTMTVSDGTTTVPTSFILNVTNTVNNTWWVRPPPHPAVYDGSGNYVPMGTGTQADPFDLFYAGDGAGGRILPGDICWLYGDSHYGEYQDVFNPTVNGNSGSPVIMRNWNNEHVTINTLQGYPGCQGKRRGSDQLDSQAWAPTGNYIWLWGVEIKTTAPNRISTQTTGDLSNPTDLLFTAGVNIGENPNNTDGLGTGCRVIHSWVHDTQQNFGMWDLATDNEIYGCVSQYAGWQGPTSINDRGHGHDFYIQSEKAGGKRFIYNIAYSGFANNIQQFGKAGGHLLNITDFGNVTLDGGELGSSGFASGLILYGAVPATGCNVISNIAFYPHGTAPSLDVGGQGESGAGVNGVVVANNIITSRNKLLTSGGTISYNTNLFYLNDFSTGPQGGLEGFTGTGQFPNNRYTTTRPPQTNVVFRTDAYEPKRGMVVSMWNTSGGSITVTPSDLSRLGYSNGDALEVCSASDLRPGHVLFAGTYIGNPITIPLSSISLAPVIGGSTHPPTNPTTDLVILLVTNGYHAY